VIGERAVRSPTSPSYMTKLHHSIKLRRTSRRSKVQNDQRLDKVTGDMKSGRVFFLVLVSVHCGFAATSALEVTYQDKKLSLDADDLAKLPVAEVDALDHQAKHHYSGVLVRNILGLLGAPSGRLLTWEGANPRCSNNR